MGVFVCMCVCMHERKRIYIYPSHSGVGLVCYNPQTNNKKLSTLLYYCSEISCYYFHLIIVMLTIIRWLSKHDGYCVILKITICIYVSIYGCYSVYVLIPCPIRWLGCIS